MGNGTEANTGDGGLASAAQVCQPTGLAFDLLGNLFISGVNHACTNVRKVAAGTNIVSTPYSGAGGDYSFGVLTDSAGNLYYSDVTGSVVYKITTLGVVTTIAGTHGSAGFSGDGGLATSAQLYFPENMVFDSAGNLYIADLGNCRVRKIGTDGIISTVVGDGSCTLNNSTTALGLGLYPGGLALNSQGAMFIADPYNNALYKVVGSTVTTLSTALNAPVAVAVDRYDNVYVVDEFGSDIKRFYYP